MPATWAQKRQPVCLTLASCPADWAGDGPGADCAACQVAHCDDPSGAGGHCWAPAVRQAGAAVRRPGMPARLMTARQRAVHAWIACCHGLKAAPADCWPPRSRGKKGPRQPDCTARNMPGRAGQGRAGAWPEWHGDLSGQHGSLHACLLLAAAHRAPAAVHAGLSSSAGLSHPACTSSKAWVASWPHPSRCLCAAPNSSAAHRSQAPATGRTARYCQQS